MAAPWGGHCSSRMAWDESALDLAVSLEAQRVTIDGRGFDLIKGAESAHGALHTLGNDDVSLLPSPHVIGWNEMGVFGVVRAGEQSVTKAVTHHLPYNTV